MKRAEALTLIEDLRIAQEIVDSDPVISVYASCEWDELHDDGKLWIAAIVAETRRRAAEGIAPRRQCTGNVRPAPFALTPSVIGRMLEETATPGKGIIDVPLAPVKLVDAPHPSTSLGMDGSEDPRPSTSLRTGLSKANDDTTFPRSSPRKDGHIEPARVAPAWAAPSAPAEIPNLGRPDTNDTSGTPNRPAVKEPSERHRKRAASPLKAPADRLAIIREAAANLASREKIALPPQDAPARISLGRPAAAKTMKLPPLPPEQRRAMLEGAIAFLKRQCVLVSVCDRDAQIRKYRVSGMRDSMLAEGVIAVAVSRGFEAPHA